MRIAVGRVIECSECAGIARAVRKRLPSCRIIYAVLPPPGEAVRPIADSLITAREACGFAAADILVIGSAESYDIDLIIKRMFVALGIGDGAEIAAVIIHAIADIHRQRQSLAAAFVKLRECAGAVIAPPNNGSAVGCSPASGACDLGESRVVFVEQEGVIAGHIICLVIYERVKGIILFAVVDIMLCIACFLIYIVLLQTIDGIAAFCRRLREIIGIISQRLIIPSEMVEGDGVGI